MNLSSFKKKINLKLSIYLLRNDKCFKSRQVNKQKLPVYGIEPGYLLTLPGMYIIYIYIFIIKIIKLLCNVNFLFLFCRNDLRKFFLYTIKYFF